MPVYRVSRPVSSASHSVSSTAYPHHYQYPAADDSTVSDGRSYTHTHCSSSYSAPGSGRLSRSHSARSLRTSGSNSSKPRRQNYYDYYDHHDKHTDNDENMDYSDVEKSGNKKLELDDLSAYTPVYSVTIRDVVRQHYDKRRYAYVSTTATTSTRTVRTQFKDCGHDQIAMAIRCAQRTDEVVRAFVKTVDMHGYTMSVSVPTEGNATVTVTENHRVPKQGKKKKIVKRTTNGPLHDILYANGRGSAAVMKQHNAAYYHQYDDYEEQEEETQTYRVKKTVPALVEDVVPGTITYVCNSGWVHPGDHHGHHRSTAQRLILALPHFSFHWSGGEFMVGSLRAAIDRESRHITISAPTLMSRLGEVYGVEDIGMKGIRNFFYWNGGESDRICRGFEIPSHTRMYYDATPKNIVRC